ncbi:deubiquitinase OTUD6B-like isoform X2 [Lytechinus variegatus]|uniref:deubiquitinase OTUD6B-like isoform X2 n=1 Tax=Lytechinus variegatus TaxID=7654 RepID=UPI001BB12DA9|nr:deubiquitinase OTUD6B-like isoform X2 [Lytechinus variegatus]
MKYSRGKTMDQDELEQKHRKERKDLQAKIQGIKKAVPKGDKKRKKEAAEEIARLEADLDQRHQAELEANKNKAAVPHEEASTEEMLEKLDISEEPEDKPQKLSKAQKRRNKKAQEEKEKAERIAIAEKDNVNSARNIENRQFADITSKRNLQIKQIPSDGHCLYNAVVHQLSLQGIEEKMEVVRQKVSDYMKTNIDEFLCFLTKPDTGDMLTADEYEKYCDDVANTAAWGGHHEMKAITEVYKKPIEVLQAEGPLLKIGEHFDTQPIMLSYHHHAYGLGEHYNSVMVREKKLTEDET